MGTRGPVPARSDQKRRRNKSEKPVDRIEVDGEVTVPPGADHWHDTASEWYRSLSDSGQARYFEPSDWQAAHFCAELMHQALTGDTNAQLVAQVRGMMSDLLTTEGARRRAGIELERRVPGGPEKASGTVTSMDARRKRMAGAS